MLTRTSCRARRIRQDQCLRRRIIRSSIRFLAAKALGPDGMTTSTRFRNIARIQDGYSFQSWAEYLGEDVLQIYEYLYIKNTLHTASDLVGTCETGTEKDAVASPDLHQIGVSVFPIPGGQTGTPTVVVAERAAAFNRNPSLNMTNPEVTMEVT
ncbi:MAG: hypothetical protein SGARI_003314 [Bacillariaceae sp.]